MFSLFTDFNFSISMRKNKSIRQNLTVGYIIRFCLTESGNLLKFALFDILLVLWVFQYVAVSGDYICLFPRVFRYQQETRAEGKRGSAGAVFGNGMRSVTHHTNNRTVAARAGIYEQDKFVFTPCRSVNPSAYTCQGGYRFDIVDAGVYSNEASADIHRNAGRRNIAGLDAARSYHNISRTAELDAVSGLYDYGGFVLLLFHDRQKGRYQIPPRQVDTLYFTRCGIRFGKRVV